MSLRAEQTFAGPVFDNSKIVNWTPFAEIGVTHNFNQQNTFAFGPCVTVTDSNTSGTGSTSFDGGLKSPGGNVRLGIRF